MDSKHLKYKSKILTRVLFLQYWLDQKPNGIRLKHLEDAMKSALKKLERLK